MVCLQNGKTFFPTETEARRELARVAIISKHHYHPQIIQFDILDDPLWQSNIETKQGPFQLDRYRPCAFQHGSMAYNPRDHEWIPNATHNAWANSPGKTAEHDYHFIHTLGWSLSLTNITLIFNVKSKIFCYGKSVLNAILNEATVPQIMLLKPQLFWSK